MENILEALNESAVITDDALRVAKTLPKQSIAAMGKLETALNDTYLTARQPKATIRLPRYGTETNSQIESDMQRVTSLFEQYVKLCQSLNYETVIADVRMEDPAKLTDTIAANLQLSIEQKQGYLRFSILRNV